MKKILSIMLAIFISTTVVFASSSVAFASSNDAGLMSSITTNEIFTGAVVTFKDSEEYSKYQQGQQEMAEDYKEYVINRSSEEKKDKFTTGLAYAAVIGSVVLSVLGVGASKKKK